MNMLLESNFIKYNQRKYILLIRLYNIAKPIYAYILNYQSFVKISVFL